MFRDVAGRCSVFLIVSTALIMKSKETAGLVVVCKSKFCKKNNKNRECSNLLFFTASHLLINLSVHLNFVPLTLEHASWLDKIRCFVFPEIWLVKRDERRFVISSTWKQSRFQDKPNSCVRVSSRKTSSDVYLEKAKALHRILPESENEFLKYTKMQLEWERISSARSAGVQQRQCLLYSKRL